ncbi:MAG: hypothetical protein K5695_12495 [Oscillospiraceae bacterium]|nr:hypothetical protein [Oscillospiraceae bacterium]
MNFFLTNTLLFHGIKEEEIKEMLSCLNARERSYSKDEVIIRAGLSVKEIGLILSGSVNIVVNFYWGSSHIFGHICQDGLITYHRNEFTLCEAVRCE